MSQITIKSLKKQSKISCILQGESCSSIKMKRKGHKFNKELTPGRTLKITKRPLEKQRSAGILISEYLYIMIYVFLQCTQLTLQAHVFT